MEFPYNSLFRWIEVLYALPLHEFHMYQRPVVSQLPREISCIRVFHGEIQGISAKLQCTTADWIDDKAEDRNAIKLVCLPSLLHVVSDVPLHVDNIEDLLER